MKKLTYSLDEVIVQNNINKSIKESTSTYNIDKNAVISYPGSNNDPLKVLQTFPSIMPTTGGFRNDLIVRGGGPGESVYYLDDMEVPVINHFSTQGSGGGAVGIFNIGFVENIQFKTSGFSVAYDNVLSSLLVINQISGNTKKPSYNIRIGASEAGITINTPLFKNKKSVIPKTTLVASVRNSYLKYLLELLDINVRPQYWDYQFKLAHSFNNNNIIKINMIGSNDKTEIHDLNSDNILDISQNDQEPIMRQNSLTLGATWRRTSKNEKKLIITTLSRSQFSNYFKRFADNVNENDLLFSHKSTTNKTYLSSTFNSYFRNSTLSLGFKIQHLNYLVESKSSVLQNFDYVNDLNFNRVGFHLGLKGNNELGNLFYDIGVRLDSDSFLLESNLIDHISPRASFKVYLSNKTFINTSLGIYFRMPPVTALGFKENDNNVNRNLKYIRSGQLDIGLGYQKNNFERYSLTAFFKNYSDYPFSLNDQISIANKGVDFEIYGNENLISSSMGNTYGVEFFYQRQLFKKLYSNISYTLFKSEFSNQEKEFNPSSWDTRHIISMNSGLKMGKNWETSFRFRFNGKQPFAIADLDKTNNTYPIISYNYSTLGKYKLDAFFQGDIRVDKRYNFSRMAINFYVEVLNCFFNSVPIPPQYNLYDFQDTQTVLPVLVKANNSPLPTIGLVLDF